MGRPVTRSSTKSVTTPATAPITLTRTLKSSKAGVTKSKAKPKPRLLKIQAIAELADSEPTPSNARLIAATSVGSIPDTDRPATPDATNVPIAYPPKVLVDSHGASTTAHILDEATAHLLKVEPKLANVINQHHCKLFTKEGLAEVVDPFQSLASGIISQQVSGAAAASIKAKFVNLFVDRLEGQSLTFPTPSMVLATPHPTLRTAGLSERKAEYLHSLSEAFVSGDLSPEIFVSASDEDITERLVKIRGIGLWSAEMFLIFGLRRMDVFSTGDLGIQRGMAVLKGRNVKALKNGGKGKWKYMAEKEMVEIAERFKPYRSLFCWYMWRIGDTDVEALEKADGEKAEKKRGRKKVKKDEEE